MDKLTTKEEEEEIERATGPIEKPSLGRCVEYAISYFLPFWFPFLDLHTPTRCWICASVVFPAVAAGALTQVVPVATQLWQCVWGNETDEATTTLMQILWQALQNPWFLLAELALLIDFGAVALLGWAADSWRRYRLEATEPAIQALAEGMKKHLIVLTPQYTLFLPPKAAQKSAKPVVPMGLLYLPGALVDHRAYTRVALALARDHGIVVAVINSEPQRLVSKATGITLPFLSMLVDELQSRHDLAVQEWALGGHSIGAGECSNLAPTIAQQHASSSQRLFGKLVMHAKASPPTASLRDSPLAMLIINGTNDGFCNLRFKTPDNKIKLLEQFPPQNQTTPEQGGHLTYAEIQGGNHSGFGDYPHQTFPVTDGTRTIALQEQHRQVVDITAQFLLRKKNAAST